MGHENSRKGIIPNKQKIKASQQLKPRISSKKNSMHSSEPYNTLQFFYPEFRRKQTEQDSY